MRILNTVRHCAIIASSVMLAGCAIAERSAKSSSPVYPHVKRPNLVVADMDRSLMLYRDIIGLTAAEPSVSASDSYSYPVFNVPKGTPIRSVTLDEHSESRVLALTELKTVDLPPLSDVPRMSAVVIGVSDLEGTFDKLKSLGLTVTDPDVTEGAEFVFVEQAFIDFDGHLIVCYEILSE